MTVLSDKSIIKCIEQGLLKIDPYSTACLSPSGYDLRSGIDVSLPGGACSLVNTLERVELSSSIAGQLFIRSSFAREGIIGSFGFVDPGFKGQLTVLIANLGTGEVLIRKGERFLQMVFHKLDSPSSRPYAGKYQDSNGIVQSRRNFQSNM